MTGFSDGKTVQVKKETAYSASARKRECHGQKPGGTPTTTICAEFEIPQASWHREIRSLYQNLNANRLVDLLNKNIASLCDRRR